MFMLEVESMSFAYDANPVLKNISFVVPQEEIVALIGISGSGKTTLFRLITGLTQPIQGQIKIGGKLASQNGGLMTTYMRQEDLLLPWRTVLQNLLLTTELGKNQKQAKEVYLNEAHTLLKRVGLEKYSDHYPNTLSGGMRQRVALARALIGNRPLMLLDEPFASLDLVIREQLYKLIQDIREQYKKTILMVTHDFRDAMTLADRILILSEGSISGNFPLTSQLKSDPIASNQMIEKIRELLLNPF
ncbi:MAG: ABC transporter ATP-binding protein [Chlamydiales bacterium]